MNLKVRVWESSTNWPMLAVLGLVFCSKSEGDAEQSTQQHLLMEDLTCDMF